MTNQLKIGQVVRNFNDTAKVVGFHETTGDPILQHTLLGCRWLADASKCEVIAELSADEVWKHKDGFVYFV